MNIILGAGIAGLSASYHLGHDHCLLLEKSGHAFGHIHSEARDGYVWDQGPHVSFTQNDYVKDLFARSVQDEYEAFPIQTMNYFRGHWIQHPAQCNLHQIPEPLRQQCLDAFLARRNHRAEPPPTPQNYGEWLVQAFGDVFAGCFPAPYTRKYWTVEPHELGLDWIGPRVYYPSIDEVIAGAQGPLAETKYYITNGRYPRRGGYQSFALLLSQGANIRYGAEVEQIDLVEKRVWLGRGSCFPYTRLINTLPLPTFVHCCVQATKEVRAAAHRLNCSQLLLVNATAAHQTQRLGSWIYVYDEDKLSTRINCTERLSPFNAPPLHTGVQVEVYFGKKRGLVEPPQVVGKRVVQELVEMGLLVPELNQGVFPAFHTRWVPWANVVFDQARRPALQLVLDWLTQYGLQREADDLDASSDWNREAAPDLRRSSICLAGRFGQWKYYWTDDCVLRGRQLAHAMH